MCGSVRWRCFLGRSLIIAAFLAVPGCAGNPDETAWEQDNTVIDWNSPRMREVEKEWQPLWDAYGEVRGGSKDRYIQTVKSVDRLLQKRLSRQSLRQLAATADRLPTRADDRSPFSDEVLAFLVKSFVESGDREALVGLLSRRCPSRIDWPELIEFYLAFRGKKLKAPILILGEAYAKCQVPETRHVLAAAVRRAFADFGIHDNDDAEYVGKAMRWYENAKNDLVVNQGYTLNETSHGGAFTMETYEAHPEYYDNPPGARDPLFRRSADPPRKDGFLWLLLWLTTIAAGVAIAPFTIRAKHQRLKKVFLTDTREL